MVFKEAAAKDRSRTEPHCKIQTVIRFKALRFNISSFNIMIPTCQSRQLLIAMSIITFNIIVTFDANDLLAP